MIVHHYIPTYSNIQLFIVPISFTIIHVCLSICGWLLHRNFYYILLLPPINFLQTFVCPLQSGFHNSPLDGSDIQVEASKEQDSRKEKVKIGMLFGSLLALNSIAIFFNINNSTSHNCFFHPSLFSRKQALQLVQN